jgi:hypothetical protein
MIKYLLNVKNVQIIPKSYTQDYLAQYQGSKGHNATSDVGIPKDFSTIIEALQTGAFLTPCKDLAQHMLFAMKWEEKLTHHTSYQYIVNIIMRYKLEFV